jgi:hypothetical protein
MSVLSQKENSICNQASFSDQSYYPQITGKLAVWGKGLNDKYILQNTDLHNFFP